MSGRGEGLVAVQRFGAAEIEIELVARGLLHRRGEASQDRVDLAALRCARLPRDRHDRRAGTETHRARHGHRGMHAVGTRLVRGRGHHPAPLGGSSDNEKPCLARPGRIREARDGHVKRIGVGEQDPTLGGTVGTGAHGAGAARPRKICSTTRRRSARSSNVSWYTRSVDPLAAPSYRPPAATGPISCSPARTSRSSSTPIKGYRTVALSCRNTSVSRSSFKSRRFQTIVPFLSVICQRASYPWSGLGGGGEGGGGGWSFNTCSSTCRRSVRSSRVKRYTWSSAPPNAAP